MNGGGNEVRHKSLLLTPSVKLVICTQTYASYINHLEKEIVVWFFFPPQRRLCACVRVLSARGAEWRGAGGVLCVNGISFLTDLWGQVRNEGKRGVRWKQTKKKKKKKGKKIRNDGDRGDMTYRPATCPYSPLLTAVFSIIKIISNSYRNDITTSLVNQVKGDFLLLRLSNNQFSSSPPQPDYVRYKERSGREREPSGGGGGWARRGAFICSFFFSLLSLHFFAGRLPLYDNSSSDVSIHSL